MRYAIEFSDTSGSPSLIERDVNDKVIGWVYVKENGEDDYRNCNPPAWMLTALADAWQAWYDRNNGGETA